MAIKKLNVEAFRDQVIEQSDKDWTDWASKNTIIFGSLIGDGFDWGRNDWKAYNVSDGAMALLRPRINQKIEDRFYTRELGILPPDAFRRNLKSRIEQAVAKHGYLYQMQFEGLNFTNDQVETLKNMEINSEYPQTILDTINQDYASNGQLQDYRKVTGSGALNGLMAYHLAVNEPDAQVLEDIEICFSQVLSRNF